MREEEHLPGNSNCPYSWLDEWLCEYVDGTMDPSLRRVFDKYVQANPDLKAHVERLRHTRQLLCACSQDAQQEASDEVCARLQEKVECNMLRTPRSLEEVIRERPVAAFTSTLVVALVVGMFTGAALFAPELMPMQMTQEARTGSTSLYERSSQRAGTASHLYRMPSTMPNAAPLASFHPFMEYNAGMPYTIDSTSEARSLSPAFVQP